MLHTTREQMLHNTLESNLISIFAILALIGAFCLVELYSYVSKRIESHSNDHNK